MNPPKPHYWTSFNTVLLVIIFIGLALLATTSLWVPKLVNHILAKQSQGRFVPLSAQINNY